MKNPLVAEIFRNIAELLEIKGDNPFRIRAYLRAAEDIESMNKDVEELVSSGQIGEIPGIGKDLAAKIQEIVETGKCRHYEDLQKDVPAGVIDMLKIPSVGPKSAKIFFEKLNIRSVKELEKAARDGRLLGLPGIKEKTVKNILKGIALVKKGLERMDLLTATTTYEDFFSGLRKIKEVKTIIAAGSLRRMKETVRDIDILVVSDSDGKIIPKFTKLPQVKRVLAEGATKASVLTHGDAQVDLRVLDLKAYGAALLYFTGSKNHNIKLRQLAIKLGLKISEYGVFNRRGKCLASETEEEVYKALKLDYIPPELREDTGEIEMAAKHRLPSLIESCDIKGDFHAHTDYSDGKNSIEEMARAALALGYSHLALTDHSASLKVAHGLDLEQLKKKRHEIDRISKSIKNFHILFGAEVEIDSGGCLDYDDKILSQFDVVVAAIHSGFKQSKRQLTQRIVRACQNKYVHIIAHPTGKLLRSREPYDIDFKEIFKVARDTNTALEINAHPYRLDLSDVHARWASESGVKLAISTDSHDCAHLGYMKFGVGLARRAWLRKGDVLNSLSLDHFLKAIRK